MMIKGFDPFDYPFDFPLIYSTVSEDRFLMLGMSNEARVLIVCHCEKDDGDTIHIISARKATNKERKFYEGDANER